LLLALSKRGMGLLFWVTVVGDRVRSGKLGWYLFLAKVSFQASCRNILFLSKTKLIVVIIYIHTFRIGSKQFIRTTTKIVKKC